MKAVTDDIDVLVNRIRCDHLCTLRFQCDEPLPVNIFNSKSGQGQSTSSLNSKFIHSELSMDVLLRMKCDLHDRKELLEICKKEYRLDQNEMKIIDEFETSYTSDRAIWWYTRESFLYKLLNKALRTQNTDVLYLFRFFLIDIERQLETNRCSETVRVYRSQLISKDELSILKQSVNQLISINSFLSTSLRREQALRFLEHVGTTENLTPVLFIIDANPRLEDSKPFANITSLSFYTNEEEVLFMVGSIFRLVEIFNRNEIVEIFMELSTDRGHEVKPILNHMKHRIGDGDGPTDLLSFGTVLCNMGKFDDAERYFQRLLSELPSTDHRIADIYHNLGEVTSEKGDFDVSVNYFRKSIEMKQKRHIRDSIEIARSYNSIGTVYRKKGDNQMSLESYHAAIHIYRQTSDQHCLDLAQCLNNIGNIHQIEKRYQQALTHFEQALVIQKQNLPKYFLDIGVSYSNIGNVYQSIGDYRQALENYQTSLEILEKCLPADHPSISVSLKNMGLVSENIGQYDQALIYFRKAADIRRKTLPPKHPNIQIIEEDIQRVKNLVR